MRSIINLHITLLLFVVAYVSMSQTASFNCIMFGSTGYFDLTDITKLDKKSDGHYFEFDNYLFRPCTGIDYNANCTITNGENIRFAVAKGERQCERLIKFPDDDFKIEDGIGSS